MKKLLTLFLLLACLPALAQTHVTFTLANFTSTPVTNRSVWITPMSTPTVSSPSVIIGDRNITNSGTGVFTLSNAVVGLYYVQIKAPPSETAFKVLVTATNLGTIQASTILSADSTATFPAGTVAWAAATTDARYAAFGTAGAAVAAGTNVTAVTNGSLVTISSTGGGSGVSVAAGTNSLAVTNGSLVTVSGTGNAVWATNLSKGGVFISPNFTGTTGNNNNAVRIQGNSVLLTLNDTNQTLSLNGIFSGTGSLLTDLNYNFITNPPVFQQPNGAWYWTNVLQAGALGGVADDTALVQSLANRGIGIEFPNSTNYTLGTVYLTNNARVRGFGTVVSLLNTVSNAALFDCKSNTNNEGYGFIFLGGAMGGTVGTTNRVAIAPYHYGEGSSWHDCQMFGFDYAVRPFGDKTVTTSHQSPHTAYYNLSGASNFCGLLLDSPDASHVVEYATFINLNFSGFNRWGLIMNAGNNNLFASHFDNNGYGFGIPGSGVNNSHSTAIGCSANHNTIAGFAITNVTSGQIISGWQMDANTDFFVDSSQGLNIYGNHFSSGNMWFVHGSPSLPNWVHDNTCAGFGGGSGGPFSIIDLDGSVRHKDNPSMTDTTGDYCVLYATNMPSVASSGVLTHTNSYGLVYSNGVAFYIAVNNGTGTRADYPIQFANGNASGLTNITTAQLGSGSANSSSFLRGDQVWAVPPGGGDVAQSAQNNLTGSNSLSGLTMFSNNAAIDAAHQLSLSNITASSVVATDSAKRLTNLLNGGANTFLQGTTPPTYTSIPDAALSSNVALRNASNNFSGLNNFSNNAAMDAASTLSLSNLSASSVLVSTSAKQVSSIAGGGAGKYLEGTTPPTWTTPSANNLPTNSAWSTNGNNGLNASAFLGTLDAQFLRFKVNGESSGTIKTNYLFTFGSNQTDNVGSPYSVILGGFGHSIAASGTASAIIGGQFNTNNSSVSNSVILGGSHNIMNTPINGQYGNNVIVGGEGNTIGAGGWNATVVGGHNSTASGTYSTVIGNSSGGTASGSGAIVLGSSTASATDTIAIGPSITASHANSTSLSALSSGTDASGVISLFSQSGTFVGGAAGLGIGITGMPAGGLWLTNSLLNTNLNGSIVQMTNGTLQISNNASASGSVIVGSNIFQIDTTQVKKAVQVDTNGTTYITTAAITTANVTTANVTNLIGNAIGLTNLPMVTSFTIPMGAFMSNNVADGATLTAASAQTPTNTGDGFIFADAVTNAIVLRSALPWDWDGGTVRYGIRFYCTGTNHNTATNVVWLGRATAIGNGDRENVLTWGTGILSTNGVGTNTWTGNEAISGPLTIGNTPTTSKSVLWQFQRLGNAAGDSETNGNLVFAEARVYYGIKTITNFPVASP